MKHIKWYTWVGLGLIFFIMTITLGKLAVFIKDVAYSEPISVEVKSTQIETGIRIETETKEANSFTSVKNIPYTGVEVIDVPIHDWANKQEEAFFKEMESHETFLNNNIHAHFSLQSEVIKLTDHLFNVKMELLQSVNQENEYKQIKTFAFDTKVGKMISFKELVNESIGEGDALISIFTTYSDSNLNEDQIKQYDLENFSWIIQDNEIIFYFNPGEIADQSIQINVPLTDFYSYFTDEYYKLFITEDLEAEIAEMEAERKAEEEKKRLEALASKKVVALTFDDGPNPYVTNRILKTLAAYNAKATFYMLSNNVVQYPDVAKTVAMEGHEIANHSVSHANLNAVSNDQARNELVTSQKTIEDVTGIKPNTFRPPYGNYNSYTLELANETNQSIIMWSVDTRDWESKNANAIYQQTINHTVSGSIVLMHDIHATTADALPNVLEYLTNQGFEFLTVTELLPLIEGEEFGPYYGN